VQGNGERTAISENGMGMIGSWMRSESTPLSKAVCE